MQPFRNEPVADLSDPAERAALLEALEGVRSRLGARYPLIIGGEEIFRDETIVSVNPARPAEVVGYVSRGSRADAEAAVAAAETAFESWRATDPEERSGLLLRVAAGMRARRREFAAWNLLEAGKSWLEADGEIAETIDFFEYYARQLLRLVGQAAGGLERHPLERNSYRYLPLGVGAIIPPWNFPTAQLVGLTSASVVTGNTVVVKPASATPVIAYHVLRLFEASGAPPGVVNFVPGSGAEVGDALVCHPRTRFIGFTGSKEVGCEIFAKAAQVQPGQRWLKRTVLEMGGKNAVVVDETADLDKAAEAILDSAFSYQGQKCSAGSRAIVVAEVYDELLARVKAGAEALAVGDTTDFGTFMGPVIDGAARRKILDYIEIGRHEGRVLTGGRAFDLDGGSYLEPTVIADVAPDARVAQEEIFGPVLTVIRASDFDDALEIANGTEYGLTGSLFSSDRERLERAARDFHAGNLYLNRKSVAAEVGIHPFGGFNMSGTDSKAGGPDYLLLFLQGKSVSEKIA